MSVSRAGILIVDDEPDIRDALQGVLESIGYKVFTAANGREALDASTFLVGRPDLIFLDLMMPVMNGAEFMEERRNHPVLKDVPVVVISADANAEAKASGLDVQACLKKPLQLDVLLAWAEKYSDVARA